MQEYSCVVVIVFHGLQNSFAAFHPRVGFIPLMDVLTPVSRGLRRFSTQRYPLDESACNLGGRFFHQTVSINSVTDVTFTVCLVYSKRI